MSVLSMSAAQDREKEERALAVKEAQVQGRAA